MTDGPVTGSVAPVLSQLSLDLCEGTAGTQDLESFVETREPHRHCLGRREEGHGAVCSRPESAVDDIVPPMTPDTRFVRWHARRATASPSLS